MGFLSKLFFNPSVYRYKLIAIDGGDIDLSKYKGRKILFVNTASACGLTPQFEELEEFYRKYKNKVVVVGLPCNDFGGQEPLTEKEICLFAVNKFDVTFPLTTKINIKTTPVFPLYEFLTKKALNGYMDSNVSWNFQKYLCDEKGHLIHCFEPDVSVFSDEVLAII